MTSLSRARALGIAGAAAVAAAPALTAALAAPASPDVPTLLASLALERSAIAAYTAIIASPLVTKSVGAVLAQFQTDHASHRDALVAALTKAGGTPGPDSVTPDQSPTIASEADALTAAEGIERNLASGYLKVLAGFRNRDLATLSGSILGVETAHVALLTEALKQGGAYTTGFVT